MPYTKPTSPACAKVTVGGDSLQRSSASRSLVKNDYEGVAESNIFFKEASVNTNEELDSPRVKHSFLSNQANESHYVRRARGSTKYEDSSNCEELSETELELRKAGVFFRLPKAASSHLKEKQAAAAASHLNDHEKEVSDVLNSLDSTLARYSNSSSGSTSDSGGSPDADNCTLNRSGTFSKYNCHVNDKAGNSATQSTKFRNHIEDCISESLPVDSGVPAAVEADSGAEEAFRLQRQSDRRGGTVSSDSTVCSSGTVSSSACSKYCDGDLPSAFSSDFNVSKKVDFPTIKDEVSRVKNNQMMSVKCLSQNYERSSQRSASDAPVVTIEPYNERQSSKLHSSLNSKRKSVSDLKNNFHNGSNADIKLTRHSMMEPLNLIEEVYVPESSVAIRSYFPSMEFSGRTAVTVNKSQRKSSECEKNEKIHHRGGDSDSGHGSGATSPCGTLTDPPSPPPTPPDTRQTRLSQSMGRQIPINNFSPALHSAEPQFTSATKSQVSIVGSSSVEHEARDPPHLNLQSPPSGSSPMNLDSAVVSPSNVDVGEVTVTSAQPVESNHFVVVAIDFGTTYSGYAFSFTRDPDNVHMMKKWEGGDPGVQNQKTPTIVLLDPDKRFHSLGFSARDHYHDLDPKEANKWLYFDKFKMELHDDRSLSRDTLLAASNGEKVPALEIFSHALGYFRDHALRELSDLTGGIQISEEDVRWVITVPAIWSHPAKQFMRTAAYMAGLANSNVPEQLLIALEPEAAAIYCRKLHRHQLVPAKDSLFRNEKLSSAGPVSSSSRSLPHRYRGQTSSDEKNKFPEYTETESPRCVSPRPYSSIDARAYRKGIGSLSVESDEILEISEDEVSVVQTSCASETVSDWLVQDTVYMVVDCGGGTVDITVHQMTDTKTGHLKELHKATGGPYGSTGVDKQFEKLLDKIFTPEFMVAFKQQKPAAFVDLMVAFESRKRNASPLRSNPLNIALPFSFIDMYKKTRGKDVESAVRKHGGDMGVQWSSQGMLRVSQDTMKALFRDTLENIQQSIESVLSLLEREASTGNSSALQYLFLVGGFSESELLQQHIRDAFSHRVTVVIPQGMGLAILRGAVQFGLDPSVVTVRRSRLTYGVGVLNRFQEGVHPLEKRVYAAGADWCADVLDVFVRVDESVAVGDVVSRSYTPATLGQSTVVLHLYATHDTKRMHFVSDAGVERVGTLYLDLKDTWEDSALGGPCCSNSEFSQKCSHYSSGDKDIRDDEGPQGPSHGNCRNEACCGGNHSGKSISSSQIVNNRREISVHLKFGDTEVKASAVDHATGKCVRFLRRWVAADDFTRASHLDWSSCLFDVELSSGRPAHQRDSAVHDHFCTTAFGSVGTYWMRTQNL
ncbi:hypothetical protein FHG87_001435 [Trinorchestia longiramus]|nr:hypothetical protein FHG87_001435 [Trinorchestia longiramus]